MHNELATTRRALHAVAELVLAGPQYRALGDLRLQVRPDGFGTVVGPDVRVAHTTVIRDDVLAGIDGASAATLAKQLGLSASALTDVYSGGPGVSGDELLQVCADAAAHLAACFELGDTALGRFEPEAERVLWPEHFDVAIRVGDINYGVSPGDGFSPVPYAYVGPGRRTGDPFWNAPFGAAMPVAPDTGVDAVVAFFRAGRAVAAGH